MRRRPDGAPERIVDDPPPCPHDSIPPSLPPNHSLQPPGPSSHRFKNRRDLLVGKTIRSYSAEHDSMIGLTPADLISPNALPWNRLHAVAGLPNVCPSRRQKWNTQLWSWPAAKVAELTGKPLVFSIEPSVVRSISAKCNVRCVAVKHLKQVTPAHPLQHRKIKDTETYPNSKMLEKTQQVFHFSQQNRVFHKAGKLLTSKLCRSECRHQLAIKQPVVPANLIHVSKRVLQLPSPVVLPK
jgi:hypothetical protein